MAVTFEQFDTTQGNLINDLATKIAAHPDWEEMSITWPTTNLTSSASSSSTTFTVESTAGMFEGQRVMFMVGGTNPIGRLVTSVTSPTTFTVSSSLGSTANTSTTVTPEGRVLKATTTRGAPMIIDLLAGNPSTDTYRMDVRFWSALPLDYTQANPSDATDKSCYWRPSGGTSTQTIHVILSISKEHLFISLEGPRSYETGTANSTYGSLRNYVFMSDLVPYHAADVVPTVVAHGTPPSAAATVSNGSFLCYQSRDSQDTESWPACRLASLAFPTIVTTDTVSLEPKCSIDGNHYLFPYVVFSDEEGIRGRLARFFFAGGNFSTYFNDVSSSSGELVTFDGIRYKLLSVNVSDSSNDAWGAFGASDNGTSSRSGYSAVVAVPFADVV